MQLPATSRIWTAATLLAATASLFIGLSLLSSIDRNRKKSNELGRSSTKAELGLAAAKQLRDHGLAAEARVRLTLTSLMADRSPAARRLRALAQDTLTAMAQLRAGHPKAPARIGTLVTDWRNLQSDLDLEFITTPLSAAAGKGSEITALCLLSWAGAFVVILFQRLCRRAILDRTLCNQQCEQLQVRADQHDRFQLAASFRTTTEGVVLNASPSFHRLLPAGIPVRIQDCFENPEVWAEILQKVTSEDCFDCDLHLRQADVSVPTRQRFWAVRDAAGHLVEIEASVLDLTAHTAACAQSERLQDMLAQAARELEQQNAQIQKHAAAMSRLRQQIENNHRDNLEFIAALGRQTRRPLVSLLQLAGATHELSGNSVAEATASARSTLAWLDTITEFATVETTRPTPTREPFSLHQVVGSAVDHVALAAEHKTIDLSVTISRETPDLVLGDGPRLEQLLAALLENAVACCDSGAIRLRLGLLTAEGPERRVAFHLNVSGSGLPPGVGESGGNPLAGKQDREVSAIRLRLAIAQRIAERTNANLSLHNKPGDGTEIEFSIPIVVQQHDAAARPDLSPLQAIPILVVEPAPASREAVTETLRGWGMKVATAVSSEAALAQLQLARSEGRHFRIALIDSATPPAGALPLIETVLDDTTLHGVHPILVLPHSHRLWQDEPLLPGLPASLSKPLRDRELAAALLGCLQEEPQPVLPPRSRRVLVAEDDAVNRRIALRLVQRMGYEADGVTNGEEAVEALRLRPYGVVFMDCMMPVMDGFRATALIRALPGSARNVPIVALTAKALAGDRRHCLDAGMNDYLSKPFTFEDLRASIERWIDTPAPAEPPALASSPSA